MAYHRKLHNKKIFKLVDLQGNERILTCFTDYGPSQYGFRHILYVKEIFADRYYYKPDFKQCWCNRTWERYQYESVLNRFLNTCNDDLKEHYKKQIELIHNNDMKALDELINNFKSNYEQSSNSFKNFCKDTMINSVDDIEKLNTLAKLDKAMQLIIKGE